ncbi:Uncharacterised protein [Vibrio cholerae]|nr:Uncharacterised protein [Vibrio cholerae]
MVVFQNRDHGTTHRQTRAVQRVHQLRFLLTFAAETRLHTTRLEIPHV